jgi:glycolate oxidase iron-sulfur subunit
MQTKLSDEFKGSARAASAESILRSCVHCGFCNATCPTYQLRGDELDGPRGRIYLIKQLLEGGEVGRSTQVHLDRCLTCLNCQTTCPSGVEYGKLVGIGRELVDERVPRPWRERMLRWLLREGLTSTAFAPLMRLARRVRWLLPPALKAKVPALVTAASAGRAIAPGVPAAPLRRVLMLEGCVQPAMLPNIDVATRRVLGACGIEAVTAAGAGCCGALREHLGDRPGSLDNARANIDAWWPLVSAGQVDAIVINASACGLAVKTYGEALGGDADYAAKAARIAELARDLSELLPDLMSTLERRLPGKPLRRVAFHSPCTLQHGQGLRGGVEAQLARLGFELTPGPHESHLCCGSAGTYSVLQPGMARQLRDRKLANLQAAAPAVIASANVGCIAHLQAGTRIPVRHWVELVDEALGAAPG